MGAHALQIVMKYTIIIIMLFIAISCEIPSRNTAEFSFIEVQQMTLEGEMAGFSDLWLSVDGRSQGVYELPRKIPILSENEVIATLRPGIRDNGINSFPRAYPFVIPLEIPIDLSDGETELLAPDFSYTISTKCRLDADFSLMNPLTYDEDGVESISVALEEGRGVIRLKEGEVLEAGTAIVYNELPRDGSPIYLEIEYRGNRDLDIGLIGISGPEIFKEYFVSLRSENDWKKTYVNLTDLIIASNLNGYQVLIGVDNSEGSSDVEVFVDNIKLLHF